jgi:dipeptidyl-peptidase-4
MNLSFIFLALSLPLFFLNAARAQGTRADYERAGALESLTAGKSFHESVRPHWLPDGDAFWYRNALPGGRSEYVLVDAIKGERHIVAAPPKVPRDPTVKLEPRPSSGDSSISTSLRFINQSGQQARLYWIDFSGQRKSYGELKPGEVRVQQTYSGHVWWVEGVDGRPLGVFEGEDTPTDAVVEPFTPPPPEPAPQATAPPRACEAFLRDNNVWIKLRANGQEAQLSHDGTAAEPYQEPFQWSPDGSMLVALQVEPAQDRRVYLVESSPADQLQPKLDSYEYLKPGDRIAHPHPRLFDVAQRRPVPLREDLFPNPWSLDQFHWAPDSSRFYFKYNQRGHQLERVIVVSARTGEARTIVEERSRTFIDYSQKTYLYWLDATGELVWMSERDGWNHLYLIDANTGAIRSRITRGNWNVRDVDHIDAQKRQVWIRVMGVRRGEDPYHFHLARVNLDGTAFTLLTGGDGTHQWQWSPDRRFFIDTWSRVDQPPSIELRREEDGQLVCPLEHADVSGLLATGWRPPQRFVAKGRDGQTDIFGVIFRPMNFDAARKYPVIEQIYAGPQDFFVPKHWDRFLGQQRLAELGFVVVQIDGMGTNWRGKTFHDVCWKNLKDAGFPDRIAWLRAAAAARPWMDLSRVGICGGSAGGQSALGALLFHGDFYKVAVADCGCHDNRMDKIWWNEAWMGWPVGPEYADNSNVTHAAQLRGDLLLSVGELDHNVDPSSTMQVVNALIKADKDFDLLVVPGAGHGAGGSPYGQRRMEDFFVRHLLGVEPRG